MKAVVMAGGLGTRMRPLLAGPINKHLMPVGGQPLIFWPLKLLAASGITEVLVLLNGPHSELLFETIGSGETFGLTIYYRFTPETAGASVGVHLRLAEPWVKDEPFLLLLGDSVYFLSTIPHLKSVTAPHSWAMSPDPTWDDMDKYAPVPDQAPYLQTGIWLFNQQLFATLTALENTAVVRIRDLVQHLAQQECITMTLLPPRSFIDCGTPEAVARVNARCLDQA